MGRRLALVTCEQFPNLVEDDQILAAELRRRGFDVAIAVWSDPQFDWAAVDAALLRSTWDYVARFAEFSAWLLHVSQQTRLWNPRAVVEWNADKRYLGQLAAAGVPVTPTVYVTPGDVAAMEESTDDGRVGVASVGRARDVHPWVGGEYVVKPVVSAAGVETTRYGAGAWPDAREHVVRLLRQERPVMVQEYISGVDARGETAMYFFDGEFSHSLRKDPLLASGEPITEEVMMSCMSPCVASEAELDVARAALAAIQRIPQLDLTQPLLYARIDVLPGEQGPLVLECELIEPATYAGLVPGSQQGFADAVERRLLAL